MNKVLTVRLCGIQIHKSILNRLQIQIQNTVHLLDEQNFGGLKKRENHLFSLMSLIKSLPEHYWAVVFPSKLARRVWWCVLGSFWWKFSPHFFFRIKCRRLQIKRCTWSRSSNSMSVLWHKKLIIAQLK